MTELHFMYLVWIKKVEAAKWESQRPSEKSEQKHGERVSEAEKERFSLVKQIEEFELSTQQFVSILDQAVIQSAHLREANEKSKKLTISPVEYKFYFILFLFYVIVFNWKYIDPLVLNGLVRAPRIPKSVEFDLL